MDDDDETTAGYTMTVRQYGARRQTTGELGRSGRPAATYPDVGDDAMAQLRWAHEMRNVLVSVEHAYDLAIADVWSRHPEVAASDAAIAEAQTVLDGLLERMRAQQRERRGKAKVDASLRAEVRDARAVLKAAKLARREARDLAYPVAKPALTEVAEARDALRKGVRQHFAERGLYWGTYNSVAKHHQTSDKRIRKARKVGSPADHRFHRWDATGTLAVQLQRQAGDPPRTPATLADPHGKWAGQVVLRPWIAPSQFDAMSRAARRHATADGTAVIRVSGSHHGDAQVEVPLRVHRMLPADADVTGLQLSRQRVGDAHPLSVSVTARVTPVPVREDGPVVAVHVGWRVRDDGGLRVATWVSTAGTVVVPATVADVVVSHGSWGEVVLPDRWRRAHEKLEQVRSGRTKDFDRTKEHLSGWLDEHGPLEVAGWREPVTAGQVRLWRSPSLSHLAEATRPLAVRARTTLEEITRVERDLVARARLGDEPVTEQALRDLQDRVAQLTELEAWRREDKHLGLWESNARKQTDGRRDDAWRRVAAWLARSHRLVVTDDVDIAELARGRDTDDAQIAAARANRVVAAPGRLRDLVRKAAPNHGAAHKIATAVGGNAHHRCGTVTARPDEYAAQTTVWCDACRRGFDQDHNMGLMMLSSAGEAPPPGER